MKQLQNTFERISMNGVAGKPAIRASSVIAEVDEGEVRKLPADFPDDTQTAESGIEKSNDTQCGIACFKLSLWPRETDRARSQNV